ncbi:MAG: hypothetical protein R3Y58_04520 [Eubacteriales bacterium]
MKRKIIGGIILLVLLTTGCSKSDEVEVEEVSTEVTEETSVVDTEKDSSYPATVYETCEVTDEASDFMNIILPDLATPYTLEDMDAIGGPYTFRAYADVNGTLEREYFVVETLEEAFTDEYYLEGGEVEIYFNYDNGENTYENCGIGIMTLGRINLGSEIMYDLTMGEIFDLGYWSLDLNCYEIKSILTGNDLFAFFDTYGYPNAIYGTEAYYEDTDTYFYDYIACYINDEFVVMFSITEMSLKDAEDSSMIINKIRYFTPLAWETECEYYGY